MIRDIRMILTRLFTVALLMMISMAAGAQVKVIYGKDGEAMKADEKGTIVIPQKEQKEPLEGGTITITQEKPTDGKVRVNFTVAPASGYTYNDGNITLVAFIPLSSTRADNSAEDITVHSTLTLTPKDKSQTDTSKPRYYYVDIDEGLGLWVQSVTFEQKNRDSGAKSGGSDVKVPDDFGVYYIASGGYGPGNKANNYTYMSDTPANNYYLCPTKEWCNYAPVDDFTDANTNKDKPFVTTYKCRAGGYEETKEAMWTIEKDPNSEFYYIKQTKTGNYLLANGKIRTTTNCDRIRVHVGVPDNPDMDDDAELAAYGLFDITPYPVDNPQYLVIKALGITDTNNSPETGHTNHTNHKWLTVTNGNYNSKEGQSGKTGGPTDYSNVAGIIGIYAQNDNNAKFFLEDVVQQPVISVATNGDVTITCATSNTTIYYTLDGSDPVVPADGTSDPTGPTYEYTATISSAPGITVKAVAVLSDMHAAVSQMVELSLSCSTPTISFGGINQITISTTPADATIYYTTDGSEPIIGTSAVYSTPLTITTTTTVNAIAARTGFTTSDIATLVVSQVATPTIQNNEYSISISTETDGATIYYTTDGSEPTLTPSSKYTGPFSEGVSGATVKAIAVKEGMVCSAVAEKSGEDTKLRCATPTFTRSGTSLTINCDFPSSGVKIYYVYIPKDGEPQPATPYSGSITVAEGDEIKAVAKADGYNDSYEGVKIIRAPLSLTTDNKYLITDDTEFESFVDMANSEEYDGSHYVLQANVNASVSIIRPFTGTFEVAADAEGNFYKISGLTHALFNTISGGTVKNVVLDGVNISSGTNVGAIANVVEGSSTKVASIYNCGILSGSVGGSGYVGGLVGLLGNTTEDSKCYARVINCYSYANITGGSKVGGIVGYNKYATTANDTRTMVMNCMFYGDITGGSSKAPIYNGKIITNDGDDNGVNNFNYFWSGASYVQEKDIDVYNCALSAETRYLQRFEFFRHLLNSNRELAAWWATGSSANKSEMMKWVLEPSQLDGDYPFPILKAPGYYPSVVNIDAENASIATERNKGGKLTGMGTNGKLSVTISGATKRDDVSSLTFDLVITDKDPKHFNFNYGKVQLPYFNDYCTGNYTPAQVVTGWKITSITGGTAGSYTEGEDAQADANGKITRAPYNFADRNCTNKDLYNTGGSYRVFNQGAYWDVPEGVTAITIQPYWGSARYVADACLDVVYKGDNITSNGKTIPDEMLTPSPVTTIGGGVRYTNGNEYTFTDIDQNVHSLKVYTSISEALSGWSPSGVYDYALVLVGNVHNTGVSSGDSGKKFTIMSVDFDHDNEPDYSYILRINDRNPVHPVRVDFLNIPGLGMAQKTTGGKGTYNLGIMNPLGWFESTNTSLFRVTQFEYDYSTGNTSRAADPYILQGGIFEQWVTGQNNGVSNKTTYFHLGGNVWFKEFHRGTHQDKTYQTKHPPISVTGGDFDEFYLTGLYRGDVANYPDNAECYINGGRFGIVAGAAMEGIGKTNGADDTGNIIWQIQNADIDEFYGGGLNATHPVEGSITSVITGGYIKQFCGGPKFGDMNASKTVKTTANGGCIFDTFFGAGFGGNSYSRYAPKNINYIMGDYGESKWNSWLTSEYTQQYSDNVNYKGVATTYSTQYLPMSNNVENVARLLIDFVSFSLAKTRNVTSNLTNCTINKNFYGGGSLGMVDGPVTSTLTGCTVIGNVFGAGYSADLPKVDVRNTGNFVEAPFFDENLGAYFDPKTLGSVKYEWEKVENVTSTNAIDKRGHKLRTTQNIDALGSVTGKVTLNIANYIDTNNTITTTISGDVYGGGESSEATANVEVNISGGSVGKSVYGGGDKGVVGGNTVVTLSGSANVNGNVYGGGNKALVSGSATVNIVEQ